MIRLTVLASLTLLLSASFALGQATYEVNFEATWSRDNHPGNYPSNAHFSPLIGATHNSDVVIWNDGGLATGGFEDMAETGGTGTLNSELSRARRDGTVMNILRGAGIDSPGSTNFSFEVERSHSLVSLVTMVAPSPDWFLGVHNLDLVQDGRWVESISVDLFSYDAGTDSGTAFTSGNLDTNPAEPITLLGAPLEGTPAMGTFTFNLIAVPEPGTGVPALAAFLGLFFRYHRRER